MSLITRCSACGTLFKVVADQLRISDGWVRCGHCAEVFDASADLRDETELAPVDLQREGDGEGATQPEPIGEIVPPSDFEPSVHSEVDESMVDGMHYAFEIEQEAQALKEDPLDQPFELRRADTADDTDTERVGPHGFSRPTPLEPEPEAEPELHDLSFVRQARRREFWRRPLVRAALALLVLVLAALLVGQIAYRERDRLAVSSPQLRSSLARMCDVLGCRLGAPLQIDAIAIETSAFNKLRPDTYRLNVTLKNQAAHEVAMPSMELTLTDSQDLPVMRRVLLPGDFAAGRTTLAASGDWSASVAVSVNASAAAGRIAGYRLLAFYP